MIATIAHKPPNDSAIVLQTAIALVLALTGSFLALAMLSVVARLATYIGTCSALLILQRRHANAPGTLRFPGDRLLPVTGLALSLCFGRCNEREQHARGYVCVGRRRTDSALPSAIR